MKYCVCPPGCEELSAHCVLLPSGLLPSPFRWRALHQPAVVRGGDAVRHQALPQGEGQGQGGCQPPVAGCVW